MRKSKPLLILRALVLSAAVLLSTTSLTIRSKDAYADAQTSSTAPILYGDTFLDSVLSEWTIVDAPNPISGPSNWSIVNAKGSKVLLQDSNIYTASNFEGTYLYTGEDTWSDYHVNVDINPDDDDSVFVLFRYVDNNNYYRFIMNRQENFRRLEKKVNGIYTTLAENLGTGYGDGWVNVQITLTGAEINVSVAYTATFSINDSSISQGKIALGTSGSTDCYFDNVVVSTSKHDPYADAVVDFSILSTGNEHANPTDTLGPPRYDHDDDYFDFLSIGGPNYWIVLDMGEDEEIVDGIGNDLRIYEIGNLLGGIDEEHNVYASNSPQGPWSFVGQGIAVSEFDLGKTGLSKARYIRIEDLSTKTDSTVTPGSDIDSIQALHMAEELSPQIPSNILYSKSGNTIQLSWNAVNEAVAYNVYGGSSTASNRVNAQPIVGTSYNLVNSDSSILYAVTSVATSGYESGLSGKVPFKNFLPLIQK